LKVLQHTRESEWIQREKREMYEAGFMEPILTRETHDHALALLHRVIPLSPLTAAELAVKVLAVRVLLVSRLRRGERAF
jgi:hypothetical protein